MGEFRLRASSFCSGAKGTKKPPGAAHGHLQCPIPPPPDPLFILRGPPSRTQKITYRRGKDQDSCLCAARCRSVLVEQAYTPTRAIAPTFPPSRGGLVVAPPPRLELRAGGRLQSSAPLGLQRPFGPLTSAPIFALELPGYRSPRGYIQ